MTSKEKLKSMYERLILLGALNHSNEIEKSYEQVNKDLDRLEKLNNIFGDSHICEIETRFNEIKCSSEECENCPLGIGDSICLKAIFEIKWKLGQRVYKLEKFVKEINNIFNFSVIEYKGNYTLEYKRYGITHSFDIDENLGKLLKEVFEDGR